MGKIHVKASKEYDVRIERGLLKYAGGLIANVGDVSRVVIVSDDNVFPLYGEQLKESLRPCGITAVEFVFKNGEDGKSISVYEELLEFLCENRITRKDVIVALGGGVAGDMAGFAAATYQRGIRYVQMPTTLLAMVDSSVGGKTALNLKGGKNQVGCFYQPSVVICDVDTLKTLPEKEYKAGMGEVIKYAMIGSEELFNMIYTADAKSNIEKIITKCVGMKRDVVEQDEFDTGARMLLNFGHTVGHAIEKISGYEISHGEAVAMGMATITEAAAKAGYCDREVSDSLNVLLGEYKLSSKCPYGLAEIMRAASIDKKSLGKMINVIIPVKIGGCKIKKMTMEDFGQLLGGVLADE